MDTNRKVDVGTLLGQVASMLAQNRGNLNGLGNGTHGDRMANAFEAAAEAARSASTDDAGQQLAMAAQAMRQVGRGRAANYYANGLQQAASQFQGQSGISANDLGPLLQSLLGGVQQGNPAQPGQGTLLDALGPAVAAFMGAKQQGQDERQAAMDALQSAVSGAKGTASRGYVDPGAASATGVIGGIIGALLPSVLGALMHGGASQQPDYGQQPGYGQGYGQQYEQPQQDPLGGLGGLIGGALGGLTGGQDNTQQGQPGQDMSRGAPGTGWWPFA